MPRESDRDYWLRRAADEIMVAEKTKDRTVAEAHLQLAKEYRHRAQGEAEASIVRLAVVQSEPGPQPSDANKGNQADASEADRRTVAEVQKNQTSGERSDPSIS